MKRSFEELLAFSRAAQPLFDSAYRQVFGSSLESIMRVEDVERQRRGVDVILHLVGGNRVYVDEKAEAKDTGNFFLEAEVGQQDTRGWVSKELDSHYIAYGFVDTGRVFLLPLALLRTIFIERRNEWRTRRLERTVKSGGIATLGYIPSQKEVLQLLMEKLSPVQVSPSWRLPSELPAEIPSISPSVPAMSRMRLDYSSTLPSLSPGGTDKPVPSEKD